MQRLQYSICADIFGSGVEIKNAYACFDEGLKAKMPEKDRQS